MVEMQNPSPSDLCWNVKFSPEQDWIEEPLHTAVGNIWGRAHHIARSQLGDEAVAHEIIEAAIEKTLRRLQEDGHRTAEDVARLLERSLQQEAPAEGSKALGLHGVKPGTPAWLPAESTCPC